LKTPSQPWHFEDYANPCNVEWYQSESGTLGIATRPKLRITTGVVVEACDSEDTWGRCRKGLRNVERKAKPANRMLHKLAKLAVYPAIKVAHDNRLQELLK